MSRVPPPIVAVALALASLAACGPRRPDAFDYHQHAPPRFAAALFPPPPRLGVDDLLAPIDDDDPALRALLPREPAAVPSPARPGPRAHRRARRAPPTRPATTRRPPRAAAPRPRPRARAGGPRGLHALGPRARGRTDELELRLLRRGRGPGRVTLLVARAARAPGADDGCGPALAALALDHRAIADATVRRCYDDLSRGRLATRAPAVAAAAGQLRLRRTQLALVDDADRAWHELDVQALDRLDGKRWAEIASMYFFAFEIDEASPAGEVAGWCSVAALENARRTTEARADPDPELADRSRLTSDRLRDAHGGGTISVCSASRAEILARAP